MNYSLRNHAMITADAMYTFIFINKVIEKSEQINAANKIY